jgi:hypothetical protein
MLSRSKAKLVNPFLTVKGFYEKKERDFIALKATGWSRQKNEEIPNLSFFSW